MQRAQNRLYKAKFYALVCYWTNIRTLDDQKLASKIYIICHNFFNHRFATWVIDLSFYKLACRLFVTCLPTNRLPTANFSHITETKEENFIIEISNSRQWKQSKKVSIYMMKNVTYRTAIRIRWVWRATQKVWQNVNFVLFIIIITASCNHPKGCRTSEKTCYRQTSHVRDKR